MTHVPDMKPDWKMVHDSVWQCELQSEVTKIVVGNSLTLSRP